MYKRFNLNLQDFSSQEFIESIKEFHSKGKELFDKNRKQVESDLKEFQNMNGELSGNKIIKEWFPEIKADIFLSHSHQDEDLVISFAGWLKEKFGLTSFIDSTVWGYANDLLKEIDDDYCRNDGSNTYSYEKRNYSTSHVHMMLSTSLMNMIDRCECVIFVNTPKSFTPADDIQDSGITISPWIFSEILMSEKVRIRTPKEHRSSTGISMENLNESLKVNYSVSLNHLTPLNISQLQNWESEKKGSSKKNSLDILYEITQQGYYNS